MKQGLIFLAILLTTVGLIAFAAPSWSNSCAAETSTADNLTLLSDSPTAAVSKYHSPLIDLGIAKKQPYDLSFSIEKTTNDEYKMVSNIELHGGSFFVSPHTTKDYKGRFTIVLEENDQVTLGSDIIETPRSKESYDPHPFVDGFVNWVEVDTRYDYPLSVLTDEDFKVKGNIRFVIEPKCTLEEIPFIITQKSGSLWIQPFGC